MKISLKYDVPVWLLILVPFLYLAYMWKLLPEEVAMHYNLNGEPDRWGSKIELVVIPVLMPLLVYLIMILIPVLDPRKKIQQMGEKYHQLMVVMVLFMSVLAVFVINTASQGKELNTQIIFGLLGLFFIFLGNFFQFIKPNYFIGIRTPWTLESEEVWVATHRWSGRIWILGGVLMIVAAFITKEKISLAVVALAIVLLALLPLIFSYIKYKELEKSGR